MTWLRWLLCAAMAFFSGFLVSTTHAATWNWSLDGSGLAGTFETVQAYTGAGTYNYVLGSFAVTASAVPGLPTGGVSSGEYGESAFSTSPPYSFVFDGAQVTQWIKTGGNLADWWVFPVLPDSGFFNFIDFGWANGSIPSMGAYRTINAGTPGWNLTIAPVSAVPLPAALPLFATVLAGGGLIAWRRKRKAAKVAA